MNIYEKLQSARVELQNRKLKKSGKNKFAGFDYFELSDFLPAINEIFDKQKLFSRFLINDKQATLQIINAEDIKEEIIFSMPTAKLELKGCNEIQALGGINTYLRRYLYLNALEIVEADLFDAETGKEENKKQAKPQSEKTIDEDFDLLNELKNKSDMTNLVKFYNDNKSNAKNLVEFTKEFQKMRTKLAKGN